MPDVAEDLLRLFGSLHSVPSAVLSADVGWADEGGVLRAEIEGKSRGAAGNWVDLTGVLDRINAGQISWRTDQYATTFAAGVPAYLAQWPNVSQAEFPCWTPRAWAEAGYRVDPSVGTALVLWTASPRRGPQQRGRRLSTLTGGSPPGGCRRSRFCSTRSPLASCPRQRPPTTAATWQG